MSIEIKIPVHPAIPKFLSYRYKTKPFIISTANPYGTFLYNALSKDVKRVKRESLSGHCQPVLKQNQWGGYYVYQPNPIRILKKELNVSVINTKIYSDSLRIAISERIYTHRGSCLEVQKIHHFNSMVLDVIDNSFYVFMDSQTAAGNLIYHSILAFREKYDLREEDLAVKTLEKKYERYRAEVKRCKSIIRN